MTMAVETTRFRPVKEFALQRRPTEFSYGINRMREMISERKRGALVKKHLHAVFPTARLATACSKTAST